MRRRSSGNNTFKLIGLSLVVALGISGFGYITWQSMGQQTADEFGCYADVYQKKMAVIVDASEPRWDAVQGRALHTYFRQLYDGLAFNERLSVYTTEGDKVASVVSPRFTVCGQAKSPEDLAAVNAPEAQAGYLKREKERLFEKVLEPELNKLLSLSPDESRRQLHESPVLEMILAVANSSKLEPGDRLVSIGDMIQNSESARFCTKQNDMPRFTAFKKRRIYQGRLKPRSLAGIEVEALMLLRGGYGPFCSSEDEIRAFWQDYFEDNGATQVQFTRIRGGFSG